MRKTCRTSGKDEKVESINYTIPIRDQVYDITVRRLKRTKVGAMEYVKYDPKQREALKRTLGV